MGDYTKLIVHCEVKDTALDEMPARLEELSLSDSSYHCGGIVQKIENSPWPFEKGRMIVTLIGQTKWGDRQDEFLNWLQQFVIQGSGIKDYWAIQFDEYSEPKFWWLGDTRGDE